MCRIRSRTWSGSSSFLDCSFLFSGSVYPRAHWPSPRLARGISVRVAGDALKRRSGMRWSVLGWSGAEGRALRRARRGSARGAASARPTDHAARAAEVHVATYHEVHLVRGGDHATSLREWTTLPQTGIPIDETTIRHVRWSGRVLREGRLEVGVAQ